MNKWEKAYIKGMEQIEAIDMNDRMEEFRDK